MTGPILNATGIVVGGAIGLARRGKPLSPQTQAFFKLGLGLATVFFGLRLVWQSFGGSFPQILKQAVIAALAVIIGRLLGRLLHLQKASNHLGQQARVLMEHAKPDDPQRFAKGLNVCAILFCAAPLGILGAIHDGLADYPYFLAVKAVMDGLAMMGFVLMFGWGAMVSALPVFVFQAVIALACQIYGAPFLVKYGLLDSVNGVGGLLVCTVGLVIFEIKRVELADYLPALAVAPLVTWLWR